MKNKKYLILIITSIIIIIIVLIWSIHIREYILYYNAVNERSISKCDIYLKEYPNGRYNKEILEFREHLLYYNAINERNISKCDIYLKEYPNGRYNKEIYDLKDDLTFEELKMDKNTSNCIKYLTYIELFGKNGRHINEVSNLYEECMFNQAINSQDIDVINDFLNEFPNSKYVEEINNLRNQIWNGIILNYEEESKINKGKREAIKFFKSLLSYYSKTTDRKIFIYYEKDIKLKDWNEYSNEARDLWDRIININNREKKGDESSYLFGSYSITLPSQDPPKSLKLYYEVGNHKRLESIVTHEIQKSLNNIFGEKFFELVPTGDKNNAPIFIIRYKIRNLESYIGNLVIPQLYQFYEYNEGGLFFKNKFICHILGICIDFTFQAFLQNENNKYIFSERVKPASEIKNIKGGIEEGYKKMTITVFENFAKKITKNFGMN